MKRNLFQFLCLIISNFATIVGSHQAFSSSVSMSECTNVVHSDRDLFSLPTHAQKVAKCLELAEQLEKSSYKNTFGFCRNYALTTEIPPMFSLPNGEVVARSSAMTWEELAFTLGDTASKSGCRDGILSALQQTFFVNTENIRKVFSSTIMSLKGVLDDSFTIDDLGRLEIYNTFINGKFTEMSGIVFSGNGAISFVKVPLYLKLTGKAKLESFFVRDIFDLDVSVYGSVSGTLDSRTLEVKVNSYEVSEVQVDRDSIVSNYVENFVMEQLQKRKDNIAQLASEELTYELKKAYQLSDPFVFLAQ